MSKNLPINTLIELAQEEFDAATKKLGKLQQENATKSKRSSTRS